MQKYEPTYAELKQRVRELEKENEDLLNSLHDDKNTGGSDLLSDVFECIQDPLILLDKTMKIKRSNSAAKKYYGVHPTVSLQGTYCFELLKQRRSPCLACEIPSAVSNKEFFCFERRREGEPGIIEQVTSYPILSPHLETECALVRIKDITFLRQMENEDSRVEKMMALGVLVSGVAHETNNPNNLIMMNIQLLQDAWYSMAPILKAHYEKNGDFIMGGLPYSEMQGEIEDLIKGIQKSSNRIKQIVRGLKKYSRDDAVDMDEPVNITQAIHNAVELNQKLIADATDFFKIRQADAIPVIKGNQHQLEQVLINLIANACQALEDRQQGITISSCLNENKDAVNIAVNDQGAGIPAHLINKIMDPFFTTRGSSGGTGLGLSISAKIIKRWGGTLHATSRKHDTKFKIELPLYVHETPFKILIADDDPGARAVIVSSLKRTGRFHLQDAHNGTQALFYMGRDKPDLLIIDIHMPDVDGVEICRLIKLRPELSSIKVLVTTGFIGTEKSQEIRDMGFDTILEKPVGIKRLIQAVDSILAGDA